MSIKNSAKAKDVSDCTLPIDTSHYSKHISEEDLNKFSKEQYEENAKKMNLDLLHAVSEQRCRPIGCRLQNCLGKFRDMSRCSQLFRELNICVEKERKKVIYEYITTKKQPSH